MKPVVETCAVCRTPVKISRATKRVWAEELNSPYTCDSCLKARIEAAVRQSHIAATQSDLRAQLAVLHAQQHQNRQRP